MNDERRRIFGHTDADGDTLSVGEWVRPDGTARLILGVETHLVSEFAEVGFGRADVLRLRSALDAWLHASSPATSSGPVVSARYLSTPPLVAEDVWGTRTPCIRCGHAEGVHTSAHGCGAVANDGCECGCREYSGGVSASECTCVHIHMHSDEGCTYQECPCAWDGGAS